MGKPIQRDAWNTQWVYIDSLMCTLWVYVLITMSSKLLVIIASAEKEKVLTAIMYARNTIKYNWLEDVKVMFFGPSENLLVSDQEVALEAQNLASVAAPIACKFLSDRDDISEKISQLGVTVDYVGSAIADLIKDGYIPMVW